MTPIGERAWRRIRPAWRPQRRANRLEKASQSGQLRSRRVRSSGERCRDCLLSAGGVELRTRPDERVLLLVSTITGILFCCGFVLLVAGAELLVRGSAKLAIAAGISPLVVGLTVVAYGTSAPELAVTIQSVYSDPPRPDLAIGNVIGSNISNLLLVLGIASVVAPLGITRAIVRSSAPFMILITLVVWAMSRDGQISRLEGCGLFTGAILYTAICVLRSRRATAAAIASGQLEKPEDHNSWAESLLRLGQILIGLVLLVLGARWLVNGAVEVAHSLHVSELVIGLTIVAVGTSLPEIAASIVANVRGHGDIAAGNVVGSNIFNLLLVLGTCAMLAPQPVVVSENAARYDIPIMLLASLACWPLFFTNWKISRRDGTGFLFFYVAYVVFLFLEATQSVYFEAYRYWFTRGVLPLTAILISVLAIRFARREKPPVS